MSNSWLDKTISQILWRIPVLLVIYFLLSIPDAPSTSIESNPEDDLAAIIIEKRIDVWSRVDQKFNSSSFNISCDSLSSQFAEISQEASILADSISMTIFSPEAPEIILLENYMLELGAYTFHCESFFQDYISITHRTYEVIKGQSEYWDFSSISTKQRLYNIFTGSRAMTDEILKRHYGEDTLKNILNTKDKNITSLIEGGDILAVRKDGFLSTLYRGANIYPGHYSNLISVIDTESKDLLEIDYIKGTNRVSFSKLQNDSPSRILLCRTNVSNSEFESIENILNDKFSSNFTEEVTSSNLPFDYAMNYSDPEMLFDYELISMMSREKRELLNGGITSFQSEGLKSWLTQLGMENFEPYSPSDVLYDPSIHIVGEWVNPSMVLQEHLNSVALEILIETSLENPEIKYSRLYLPIERVRKGASMLIEVSGGNALIPRGLNSTESLKLNTLRKRFGKIRSQLDAQSQSFIDSNNRNPSYSEIRAFKEDILI